MDYQEYMESENFLRDRDEALKLMNYLAGFWEVKEDEIDFRE